MKYTIALILLPIATLAPSEGTAWKQLTAEAAFSARDTAEDAYFQGQYWLSNGYYHGNVLHRDLWSSKDAVEWARVSDATPYDGYSELVVFKNVLWAIKGSVWRSVDGKEWERVLAETPFGVRGYGECVAFKDAIWHLGSGSDVWRTDDGVKWTQVFKDAPWGDRSAAAVTVFDGKLWLMGGVTPGANDPPEAGYKETTTYNDVWYSEDGATWKQATEHAAWSPRQWFPALAYRGHLWTIGGYDNVNNTNLNDIWYSKDGKTWTQYKTETVFAPRHEPTIYVTEERILVVAGNTWPVVNDVWSLELPADWTGAAGTK